MMMMKCRSLLDRIVDTLDLLGYVHLPSLKRMMMEEDHLFWKGNKKKYCYLMCILGLLDLLEEPYHPTLTSFHVTFLCLSLYHPTHCLCLVKKMLSAFFAYWEMYPMPNLCLNHWSRNNFPWFVVDHQKVPQPYQRYTRQQCDHLCHK